MKLGLRARLILGAAVLIVTVNLATAVFLESVLSSWYEKRIDNELHGAARVARTFLEEVSHDGSPASVDPLVDRLSVAEGARLSVIAEDGRLVGDSELDLGGILAAPHHGDRPEVLAALTRGRGRAVRHSDTLDADMVYVAVSYQQGEHTGVVRAALPLRALKTVKIQLRLVLAAVAIFGIIIFVAIVVRSTAVVLGELRLLAAHARSVVHGVVDEPAKEESDDLGWLAGSLDRIAQRLEQNLELLARERDRFEAVLQGMSDAVLAVDSQDRITLVNQAATRLLGPDLALVGEPLVSAVPVPVLIDLVARVRREGSGSSEFVLPGLPRRIVDARASLQRSSRGVVLVLQELTEIRRLERIRQDFVANVSHELRTPVSVILANTETVLDGALSEDPESARRFLEAVQRNARRLSRIIADLLDISRIEAGAVPLRRAQVALARPVARVLEAQGHGAEAKGIALASEVASEIPVWADEDMLVQVLQNLVDNAVAYTPPGGCVRVRAQRRGARVRIEVLDSGPGVAPDHRERIFERFYRVDPGRSREMGGTGLGLAIVKHLVGAMGGQVGMEPNEPEGAIFWVTLPAERPA